MSHAAERKALAPSPCVRGHAQGATQAAPTPENRPQDRSPSLAASPPGPGVSQPQSSCATGHSTARKAWPERCWPSVNPTPQKGRGARSWRQTKILQS